MQQFQGRLEFVEQWRLVLVVEPRPRPVTTPANTSVVNPSTKTGGTVKYELSDAPDSFDPGNTYYAFMWNFSRLYARPLITFATKPGNAGLKLVPDLATSLGKVEQRRQDLDVHAASRA